MGPIREAFKYLKLRFYILLDNKHNLITRLSTSFIVLLFILLPFLDKYEDYINEHQNILLLIFFIFLSGFVSLFTSVILIIRYKFNNIYWKIFWLFYLLIVFPITAQINVFFGVLAIILFHYTLFEARLTIHLNPRTPK